MAATVTPLFTRRRSTVRINSEKVGFHGNALFITNIIVNILHGLHIIPLFASPQNDGTPIFMYATLFYNFFFLWHSCSLLQVVSREYIISGT